MLFTFRRHLISCYATYPHISSVAPSAGLFTANATLLLLLSNLHLTLGLCLLVRFKHCIPESFLNCLLFSWTLGPQYEARNSFHLFPQCRLKGWNFHHPAFSFKLNVSAGIWWIWGEGLIFGNALNHLPNHIPFSMLPQASGCSARAAFILYLLKCFIHLDMQRPHYCPK